MIASHPPVPSGSSSSSAWAGWLWGYKAGGERVGGGAAPSTRSRGRATVLGGGVEGEPGEPPLLVSFPSSNQQAFTEGLR